MWKLPQILIIHLKRFDYSKSDYGRKLGDKVEFPYRNLDLTPFVSSPQRESPIYDLFGITVLFIIL